MPLQNRVHPFGEICASPHRGHLMGNRGHLHDGQQRIVRPFQLQRWLICVLDFKDRRRPLMRPGHYTELFFWDEATALAAGHRPCMECQRPRFLDFRRCWQAANGVVVAKTAEMDALLHAERTAAEPAFAQIGELPDGVIVEWQGEPYLVQGGRLRLWSFAGYGPVLDMSGDTRVRVRTPMSIVRAIRAGYVVDVVG
jgi:hypothetical protein